ncbi:hypothetical protein H0N99_03305 [Candidatus Micrarchaeota archaeon]|nr:hypothetical protein [Candidatus Micrarchaeota archaeon]
MDKKSKPVPKVEGAQENKGLMQSVMEGAGVKWSIVAAALGVISIMAVRALDIFYNISIPFFVYLAVIVALILISGIGYYRKNTNPVWSFLLLFAASSMLTLECTPIIAILFLAIIFYWTYRKQKARKT